MSRKNIKNRAASVRARLLEKAKSENQSFRGKQ
jgi:hypothetical protein